MSLVALQQKEFQTEKRLNGGNGAGKRDLLNSVVGRFRASTCETFRKLGSISALCPAKHHQCWGMSIAST